MYLVTCCAPSTHRTVDLNCFPLIKNINHLMKNNFLGPLQAHTSSLTQVNKKIDFIKKEFVTHLLFASIIHQNLVHYN